LLPARAALASSIPVNVGALAYGQSTGRVEIPAGDYRIRATAAGNTGAVVYDSGTVPLAAGADLLIAAVANTGPGAAPIQLVSLDGQGSAKILDTATPAAVVAVHASPDAPTVARLRWVAVCGPQVYGEIFEMAGSVPFISKMQYSDKSTALYSGEVGEWLGVRLIRTNFVPKFSMLGSATEAVASGASGGMAASVARSIAAMSCMAPFCTMAACGPCLPPTPGPNCGTTPGAPPPRCWP
jgi:hypothetical protein